VSDSLLTLEAAAAGVRIAVCVATGVAREASARHALAAGSAAALAQGLTGALLLASHDGTRVDVQVECNGPLRGLLVDADQGGTVRGLVRVNALEGAARAELPARVDLRPVLASPHDERAGGISILRAPASGGSGHRAAFPFAGADLGGALTLFLRGDREQGGEMALEVIASAGEPLVSVAGALLSPQEGEDPEKVRPLGKPLRQGALAAVLAPGQDARTIALALASRFELGGLRQAAELVPRFGCRCSRERVVAALRSLGAPELRDMATRDGGAALTCDFCCAQYRFTAPELLALVQR
jgi:molecular chaperone Hsp33